MNLSIGIAAAASGLVLAACTMSPTGGMTQMRPDAMAYDQAHAECFERSFGAPGGGQGSDMAKSLAYYTCMRQQGWEDARSIF